MPSLLMKVIAMTPRTALKARLEKEDPIADYAREIDNLPAEERERIDRILRRIDDSMAAVSESRRILNRSSVAREKSYR